MSFINFCNNVLQFYLRNTIRFSKSFCYCLSYLILVCYTLIHRFGVPQVSNLGPLLFLLYINDISNALNTIPKLFADNTCLVIHAANLSILCNKINHELRTVLEWTSANKITVNPKKSAALILLPRITNLIPSIEILFNNIAVFVTKSVKFLGFTIDEKLNFAEHITKLTCKKSRFVGILSKLRNILPFTALRIVL